jgi:hypothetical protein
MMVTSLVGPLLSESHRFFQKVVEVEGVESDPLVAAVQLVLQGQGDILFFTVRRIDFCVDVFVFAARVLWWEVVLGAGTRRRGESSDICPASPPDWGNRIGMCELQNRFERKPFLVTILGSTWSMEDVGVAVGGGPVSEDKCHAVEHWRLNGERSCRLWIATALIAIDSVCQVK